MAFAMWSTVLAMIVTTCVADGAGCADFPRKHAAAAVVTFAAASWRRDSRSRRESVNYHQSARPHARAIDDSFFAPSASTFIGRHHRRRFSSCRLSARRRPTGDRPATDR
jgi:hypothetical protein